MNSRRAVLIALLGLSAFVPWLAAEQPQPGKVRLVRSVPESADTAVVFGFSTDGRKLLTGGGDSFAVWDVKTGQKIVRLGGKGKPVWRAAFLPNGKTVVASFWGEKEILLFDAGSGRLISRIPQPEAVEGLMIAPDGKTLAAYCVGKGVRLWEIKNRKELRQFELHSLNGRSYGTGIMFSPDGKLLAVAVGDGSVLLCDVATGAKVRRLFRNTKSHCGFAMAFSPDGRYLAVHAQEFFQNRYAPNFNRSLIRLWDVHSGEVVREFRRPESQQPASFAGEEWKIFRSEVGWWSHGLAFTPDGKTLANATWPLTQLWEVATGRLRHEFAANTNTPCFSPDGSLLVAATLHLHPQKTRAFSLWDWRDPCQQQPKAFGRQDLDRAWIELASEDAAVGYRAIATLLAHPQRAVAALGQRLRRVEPLGVGEVDRLIVELDDAGFAVRQSATERLAVLGKMVRPALLQVKNQRPSLEVRRRVEDLLALCAETEGGPEAVRCLRAAEVLETIGTKEACQVLTNLASGAPGAVQTEDAKAALQRLARR